MTDQKPSSTRRTAQDPTARRAAEEATIRFIQEAIDERPCWGAKGWFRSIEARVSAGGHVPLSQNAYGKLFAAELARRRQARIDAGRRAAEEVGGTVGEGPISLVPGAPDAFRSDFREVVASVLAIRSVAIGDAWRDYANGPYRSDARPVSAEVFTAILYSPEVIAVVPHEGMPEWWRRKVARLSR